MTTDQIRVLIVDDERLARAHLELLITRTVGAVVAGTAANGREAVARIRSLHPDLVLLDVQMPGKTGIEVVREIGAAEMPATIFVTAYDRFAVQAFDVAAVDYLVKPFDDERFEAAFEKVRDRLRMAGLDQLRTRLLAVLHGGDAATAIEPAASLRPAHYLDRIAVEMRGKVQSVAVDQVEYIVASGPYAEVYTAERRYLIREAMQTLEERLDPRRFMRVHRSAIIRLDLVEAFHRGEGGDYKVKLKGGARLPVSRSRREMLERWLGVVE